MYHTAIANTTSKHLVAIVKCLVKQQTLFVMPNNNDFIVLHNDVMHTYSGRYGVNNFGDFLRSLNNKTLDGIEWEVPSVKEVSLFLSKIDISDPENWPVFDASFIVQYPIMSHVKRDIMSYQYEDIAGFKHDIRGPLDSIYRVLKKTAKKFQ